MVPYVVIVVVAFIGAFFWGVFGFLYGAFIGFLSVLLIGWIVGKIQGGGLPRRVREETVTDFMAAHPDLIRSAYPELSAYKAKEEVAKLLDGMFHRANLDNPSMDVTDAGSPQVFVPSATKLADELEPQAVKELAHGLVGFVLIHPRWYGGNGR